MNGICSLWRIEVSSHKFIIVFFLLVGIIND